MTKTGCTSGGGTVNSDGTVTSNGKLNNLNDDMYDDFAKFIADATKLFKDNGIEFKSYSPMNEPIRIIGVTAHQNKRAVTLIRVQVSQR